MNVEIDAAQNLLVAKGLGDAAQLDLFHFLATHEKNTWVST